MNTNQQQPPVTNSASSQQNTQAAPPPATQVAGQVTSSGAAPQTASNQPLSPVEQIAGHLKQANNIVIVTSKKPKLEQVSAAVGLAYALRNMHKSAATLLSGKVPSALHFLQPEQAIESSTDRLRDFVISLHKDKADKLRYKVEDDYVKIFITPYKTVITEKDLSFSPGDYNIDTVITLGVDARNQLDSIVLESDRILRDATVINVNNEQAANFGDINWHNPAAGSLTEMLMELVAKLGNVLTKASADAFLTGLVAITDQFGNELATPQAHTLAARLISAGADQPAIVQNLKQTNQIKILSDNGSSDSSGNTHPSADSTPSDQEDTDDQTQEPTKDNNPPPSQNDWQGSQPTADKPRPTAPPPPANPDQPAQQATEASNEQRAASNQPDEPAAEQSAERTASDKPGEPQAASNGTQPPATNQPANATQSIQEVAREQAAKRAREEAATHEAQRVAQAAKKTSGEQSAAASQSGDSQTHVDVNPAPPLLKPAKATQRHTTHQQEQSTQAAQTDTNALKSTPHQPASSQPAEQHPQQLQGASATANQIAHTQAPSTGTTNEAQPLNQARQAVQQAVESTPSERPKPIEALGAQNANQSGNIVISHDGEVQVSA